MGITVHGSDELKATALLFRAADPPTRAAIRRESQAWAPTLVRAARSRAKGAVQQRIADSGKTSVTAKGLRGVFGSTGRVSGARLSEIAGPYEFGTARRNSKTKYLTRHRSSRKEYFVERRTHVQLPPRNPDGHFIYPAVADQAPALVARWVRAVAQAVQRG